MDEALIAALENRLLHGDNKESLRVEVLAAGHTPEVFESSYSEAVRRHSASPKSASEERRAGAPVTQAAPRAPRAPVPSRAKGTIHTIALPAQALSTGLVGYGGLLKAGWRIADESLGVLGGFLVSVVFLIVLIVAGAVLLVTVTEKIASGGGGLESMVSVLLVSGLAYLCLGLYVSAAGFALLRGIIKRHTEGSVFRKHFVWAWQNILLLMLVSFTAQAITQSGYMLLIIPGILATVYLGYAVYVLVDGKAKGFDALIRSFELVYGRFWTILGRKALLLSIVFLLFIPVAFARTVSETATLVVGLLSLGGLYFVFCCTIALYESLKLQPALYHFSSEEKKTITFWLWVVIGVASAFFAFSLYSIAVSFDYSNSQKMHFGMPQNQENYFVGTEKNDANAVTDDSSTGAAAAIKQQLTKARSAAELYFEENGQSYAGVCSSEEGINNQLRYAYDFGSENVACEDDRGWYLAEAELLDSGVYFCIDSTGSRVEQSVSRKGFKTCVEKTAPESTPAGAAN